MRARLGLRDRPGVTRAPACPFQEPAIVELFEPVHPQGGTLDEQDLALTNREVRFRIEQNIGLVERLGRAAGVTSNGWPRFLSPQWFHPA